MTAPLFFPVRGIQLHHSVKLDDACRFLSNAEMSLLVARKTSAEPFSAEYEALRVETQEFLARVAGARARAQRRFEELRIENPELWYAARNGDVRWPDEPGGEFQARCSCEDIHADLCAAHPEEERDA